MNIVWIVLGAVVAIIWVVSYIFLVAKMYRTQQKLCKSCDCSVNKQLGGCENCKNGSNYKNLEELYEQSVCGTCDCYNSDVFEPDCYACESCDKYRHILIEKDESEE